MQNMELRTLLPERPYRFARHIWWKLQARRISIDNLLCGGEHGLTGLQFAFHSNDLKRTSTPFVNSPHVRFLQGYVELGDKIFEENYFVATDYYRNAIQCIRMFGRYFSATRAEQIQILAKKFAANFRDKPSPDRILEGSSTYSTSGMLPEVLPIRYSDCFQVKDGNHRLAIAYMKGAKACLVRVANNPQLTSLQQLLLEVSWNVNQRDLYQPIQSPELGDKWRLVRRCTDRFSMMKAFLSNHPLNKQTEKSYLDIACNCGWFVKAMQDEGYRAFGLEIDKAARIIGQSVFGLGEQQFYTSEVMDYF